MNWRRSPIRIPWLASRAAGRGKTGGTLADWLALPWGGPELIVLPGFHTAAEDGLRKPRRGRATKSFSPFAD